MADGNGNMTPEKRAAINHLANSSFHLFKGKGYLANRGALDAISDEIREIEDDTQLRP